MTRCPDTGTLRASLDGEAPDATVHADACARCRDELAELRATALASDAALALLAPPSTKAAASSPSEAPSLPETSPAAVAAPPPPADIADARRRRSSRSARAATWQRRAAAVAVVAVMAAGVVGTPAGRQAAASFLSAFRSEQITVVTVDPWSFANAYWSLQELADVDGLDEVPGLETAPSVAAAEQRVGFDVTEPDAGLIPERFGREPSEVMYMEGRQLRIAFDADLVADWLERNDAADVAVPDGLDDTTLVIEVPSAVLLTYRGPDYEQLVVGESELVTADTEGPLSLEAVRSFLLDIPALPAETAQQLRAISDWRTTLPLPVPSDGPAWRDGTVAGHDAVIFDDPLASAVLWQADGRVRGVGGIVDAATATRIAEDVAR